MQHKLHAIRHDILTAIDEIQGFVAGRSLSELLADRAFQLVIEREFEILGEALYLRPSTFDLRPPTFDLRPLPSRLHAPRFLPMTPTLANRLGTSTHLSPLLQKAKRLGVSSPEDLEEIAITRGLHYFGQTHRSEDDPYAKSAITAYDPEFFTNEELAIALMSPALPYSLTRLRMAAAMLGAENISSLDIHRLARQERCEKVVRYIAECASKVEPNNLFWSTLLEHLPQSQFTPPDVFPHPSRFVAMSGLDRTGRTNRSQWIRPTS